MKFKRRRMSTRSGKGKVGGFFLAVLIILTLGGLGFFLIPTKATRDFSYTTSTQIGSAKITNTISGSASALDVNGQVVSTSPFQTLSSVFTASGTEIATVALSGTIQGSGTEIQLSTMQFTATYTAVLAGISVGPTQLTLTPETENQYMRLFQTVLSLASFATAIESTATVTQADYTLTITIAVTGTVTSNSGTTLTAQKSVYATLAMTWKKTSTQTTDPSFSIDVNLNVNDQPATTTTVTTTTSVNVQKIPTSITRNIDSTYGRIYGKLTRIDNGQGIAGKTITVKFTRGFDQYSGTAITTSSGDYEVYPSLSMSGLSGCTATFDGDTQFIGSVG